MLKNKMGVSLYLAAGLAIAATSSAMAQTNVQWASGVNGGWGSAGNWNPAQVPDNSGPNLFNVTLPNYGVLYTVTLDINRDMSKLDIVGTAQDTVLNLNGSNLDVIGNFTLNKGYVEGDGLGNKITVNGVATFMDGMYMWADFKSNGTVVFAGTGTEEFCDTGFDHNGSAMTWSGTGDISIAGGTVFNHNAPSTFTISHAGNNDFFGSGIDTFNNSGTIIKTGGTGTTTFRNLTFNNTGTIKVQSGQLKFVQGGFVTGGELNGAKYEVEDGAEMRMVDDLNEDIAIETCSADVTLRGSGSLFASLDSLRTVGANGKIRLESGRVFTTMQAVQNNGLISVGQTARFEFTPDAGSTSFNNGLIEAAQGGTVVVKNGAALTNMGVVKADGGLVVFETGADLGNVNAATLVGGQFIAQGGGVIRSDQLANVTRFNSDVIVRGSASDLRDGLGNSVLPNLTAVGPLGSLLLDGRNVVLANNLTVEGNSSSRGHITVAAGTTLELAAGRTITNFATGTFTEGRFTIRGELIADGIEIEQIDNAIVLDDAAGLIRNRTTGLDALRSLHTLRGAADVTVANGRDLITLNDLTALPGSQLTVGAAIGANRTTVRVLGNFDAQGNVTLDGGEIVTSGNFALSGQLVGNGLINGNMINTGVVAPGFSPGAIDVDGGFMQGAGGLLQMEIGGSQQGLTYDTLRVAGAFGFGDGTGTAGSLSVALIDGFVPIEGEMFTLVEFNRMIGTGFTNVAFSGLTGNAYMELVYQPQAIVAMYHVPAPGVMGLLCAAGFLGGRRRR